MSSREDILQNIRRNTGIRYEKPDITSLEKEAITYPNKTKQFCKTLEEAGGHAIILEGEKIDDIIKNLYPTAKRIASEIKDLTCNGEKQTITCATFHPDDVASSADLDGTDVAIINGRFGVCENGAVWIQQDVEQRAIYFISEALVILVDKNKLVNNMHEAYTRIDTGKYGYGVFISGPSKTADIEQALVMGAHGAKEVIVILV